MTSIDLPARVMTCRRWAFLTLVVATCLALFGWMVRLVGADGIDLFDVLVLALYGGTLPWIVLGLGNALIGVVLIHLRRAWLRAVLPLHGLDTTEALRGGEAGVSK